MSTKIPRDRDNDYTNEAAAERRDFIKTQTGTDPANVGQFSFDASTVPGNIENFIGVAQVPIGLAGPLLVNGEHANGEFFVPLATTEGTLVASYNRGMKLLRESGGVTATVVDDAMQRAPVFVFASAREAQRFRSWVKDNFAAIKEKAEATTSVGKLRDIQQFPASRFLYLRFNYTTGDAAGQNMVGKATKAACDWIKAVYPGHRALPARRQFRDRQKNFVGQHAAHARQKSHRRSDDSGRKTERNNARFGRADFRSAADLAARRLSGGRQQQRRAFGERHHGDVYRVRAGRRQRCRIVGRGRLRGNHKKRAIIIFR